MPERVLPEPVSPVMSQPRQKSARVQVKPASRTTARCLVARMCVMKSTASGDEPKRRAAMSAGVELHRNRPSEQPGDDAEHGERDDAWRVRRLVHPLDGLREACAARR